MLPIKGSIREMKRPSWRAVLRRSVLEQCEMAGDDDPVDISESERLAVVVHRKAVRREKPRLWVE